MMLITPSGTGNGVAGGGGVGVAVGVEVGDAVGVGIEVGDIISVGDGPRVIVGSEASSSVGSGVLEECAAEDDPPPQAASMLPITASDRIMDQILFMNFSPLSKTDSVTAECRLMIIAPLRQEDNVTRHQIGLTLGMSRWVPTPDGQRLGAVKSPPFRSQQAGPAGDIA